MSKFRKPLILSNYIKYTQRVLRSQVQYTVHVKYADFCSKTAYNKQYTLCIYSRFIQQIDIDIFAL